MRDITRWQRYRARKKTLSGLQYFAYAVATPCENRYVRYETSQVSVLGCVLKFISGVPVANIPSNSLDA